MIYTYQGTELNRVYEYTGSIQGTAYSIDGQQIHEKFVPDPYLPGRLLIFEDDFNGNELNDENWGYEVGYDLRADGNRLYRKADVEVHDSILYVKAKRNAEARDGWTQGSINGTGYRSWMYGRFEAKMKADNVRGAFPAFWCLANAHYKIREMNGNDDGTVDFPRQVEGDAGGVSCPDSGEIDIVEIYTDNWGHLTGPAANVFSTNQTPSVSLGGQFFQIPIDTTEWHVYAMEWTPQYIEAFIDNIPYKRWTFSDFNYDVIKGYLTYPFCMLFSCGEYQSDQSTTEHVLMVDWARVYAPVNVTSDIPVVSVSMVDTFRLKKGYKKYIVAEITPKEATNRHLWWASSDESVMIVDHGVIYGIDYGVATLIAVSDNGKVAFCEVTVVDTY